MEQAERGERILEAAGELLLAWGYRRVTIDEIARRAKVGKGTVYLHWKTKESLLLAVVLRVQSRSHQRQLARMRSDPLEILPSRALRGHFLDFLGEPVLRALYTDDVDILGRLNDTAKTELAELIAQGDRAMRRHLEVLREHGLVRDDMAVHHQQYALMAMATGFFTSEALLSDRAPDDPEARAEILAHTVRSALETSPGSGAGVDLGADPGVSLGADPASGGVRLAAAAGAAAPEVIALYEHLAELSAQEMRRQVRS
ncbi:TetR/AcrR family transcriptional regulator [Streptomyces inhibens]|uniref:TetR/AcrR family transcriptional regulator n=1 Tax=Streptomyces inhibens TaxID=2293571 RepID=UPI00402ABE0A